MPRADNLFGAVLTAMRQAKAAEQKAGVRAPPLLHAVTWYEVLR